MTLDLDLFARAWITTIAFIGLEVKVRVTVMVRVSVRHAVGGTSILNQGQFSLQLAHLPVSDNDNYYDDAMCSTEFRLVRFVVVIYGQ